MSAMDLETVYAHLKQILPSLINFTTQNVKMTILLTLTEMCLLVVAYEAQSAILFKLISQHLPDHLYERVARLRNLLVSNALLLRKGETYTASFEIVKNTRKFLILNNTKCIRLSNTKQSIVSKTWVNIRPQQTSKILDYLADKDESKADLDLILTDRGGFSFLDIEENCLMRLPFHFNKHN